MKKKLAEWGKKFEEQYDCEIFILASKNNKLPSMYCPSQFLPQREELKSKVIVCYFLTLGQLLSY